MFIVSKNILDAVAFDILNQQLKSMTGKAKSNHTIQGLK